MGEQKTVKVERDKFGYRINGDFYRRTTTFTGALPKPWLGRWAAKAVAEYAVENREAWEALGPTNAKKTLKEVPWSTRDDAADRGTAVHEAIEAHVNGTALPDGLNEEELDCAIAAETFLNRFVARVYAAELTVFSPTYGYAGTLDLWCEDREGRSWILDWKTSSSDSVPYTDWTIQQAAYRNAEYAVVEKTRVGEEAWRGRVIGWGPDRAERTGIVHISPERATLHPIRYSERLFTVFRAAKHIKEFMLDTDSYRKTPRVEVYDEPVVFADEEEAVAV